MSPIVVFSAISSMMIFFLLVRFGFDSTGCCVDVVVSLLAVVSGTGSIVGALFVLVSEFHLILAFLRQKEDTVTEVVCFCGRI